MYMYVRVRHASGMLIRHLHARALLRLCARAYNNASIHVYTYVHVQTSWVHTLESSTYRMRSYHEFGRGVEMGSDSTFLGASMMRMRTPRLR